jgi:hypothetical protein
MVDLNCVLLALLLLLLLLLMLLLVLFLLLIKYPTLLVGGLPT